jgi:hypothetical protein
LNIADVVKELCKMAEYVLFTDSSCDLPQELANELGLYVLPLTVKVDENEYANYLDWRQISVSDFYNLLRTGHTAVTSAVNVWAYKEAMTPVLEDGRDILCMSFSSGLSNTYQAACVAAQELREAFPQRPFWSSIRWRLRWVRHADLLCGDGKAKGQKHEEVYQWVLENACIFAIGLRWTICTISSAAAVFRRRRRCWAACFRSSRCCMWTTRGI